MIVLTYYNLHILVTSGMQYLDQVMGPILFRWVACEMNLVSLVEVTFSSNASEYVSDISIDSL